MELIAAIMAAPDYKARFKDAVTLLNYGFGNCRLYKDETPPELPKLSVTGGKEPEVELSYGEPLHIWDSTARTFPVWSGN